MSENLLSGENKYNYMTTPTGLNGSEAIVLPDPLTLLQGLVNFLLFPLFALSAMTRSQMQMQLPPAQSPPAAQLPIATAQHPQVLPPIANTAPIMQTNEEQWVWTDYKGRERQITVHRKVKVE